MHVSRKSYLFIGIAVLILALIIIIKIAVGDSSKRPILKPVVVMKLPAAEQRGIKSLLKKC